jgi:hypothetical protein
MPTPVGTTPCPQVLAQYSDHVETCPQTASVYNVGPDSDGNPAYRCECSDGHEQFFGQDFYNDNVT